MEEDAYTRRLRRYAAAARRDYNRAKKDLLEGRAAATPDPAPAPAGGGAARPSGATGEGGVPRSRPAQTKAAIPNLAAQARVAMWMKHYARLAADPGDLAARMAATPAAPVPPDAPVSAPNATADGPHRQAHPR
jgi:hypothetical protein